MESLLAPGLAFCTITRTTLVGSTCAPYCSNGCTFNDVLIVGATVWALTVGLNAQPSNAQARIGARERRIVTCHMGEQPPGVMDLSCEESGSLVSATRRSCPAQESRG